MKKYTRISLEEREKIYLLLRQGLNITCIAKLLQRNKSSISRELKRSISDPLGYIPDRAHFIYRAHSSSKCNTAMLKEYLSRCFVI